MTMNKNEVQNSDKKYLNKTLINAFKILENFSVDDNTLKLNDLQEGVDLNKSSVWRIVFTLEYLGYIESIKNDNNKYRLSFKGLNFARIILNNLDVREKAIPYMNKLSKKININVNLAKLAINDAVLIASVTAPNIPDNSFHVGRRLQLHASASGKLLLAFQNKEKQNEIIKKLEMNQLTGKTITEKTKLKEELKIIREKGYSFDREEYKDNIQCMAFPIFDKHREICASISISNRKLKFNDELHLDDYIDELAKSANDISYEMGMGFF